MPYICQAVWLLGLRRHSRDAVTKMDTFVIILDAEGVESRAAVEATLRDKYEQVYPFGPHAFLVASDDLTAIVAEEAGIKGDNRHPGATGAVFKISGYSGYTDRSLWEWLTKVGS